MAVFGDVLPFRQFVLKIHSRCDLACDHCYVYEHADQSWRGRPTVISPETARQAAERIAEHASEHRLSMVRVILHGGEPLLAGVSRLGAIARVLRRAIEPVCELDLRIHTNGVRLDTAFCEMFLAEGILVGISLDGDRAANDLHRRYLNGRSSYDQVLRAVALLRQERYRPLFAGLLATIDIRSDPVAVYRALAELDPPNLDFLLPHGTWETPPPGKRGPLPDGRLPARLAGEPGATPYADWLAPVFAEWTKDGRRVPVRMFESIIETTLGGASGTESLGLAPSDVAVIETDGTIEQADSIKVAYDGAPVTGLDVFSHSLNAAAAHPAIRARQQGIAGLSPVCRTCPVVDTCGGGLYAHRYLTGSGFANPSVYCTDLEKIITHVRARLLPQAGATVAAQRPSHSMPQAHFDALAAGFGDAESISYLSAAQRSVRRAVLRLLHERAPLDGDPVFDGGWDLLTRLDHAAPGAVDEVLAHPYVRAWAEGCLRNAGRTAVGTATRSTATRAGHLASVAAAAAIRSGTLAEAEVPVSDGYAHLPTLGRLRAGDARTVTIAVTGPGQFEARATSGKWRVEAGVQDPASETEPDWQPVRVLRSGEFTVRLEDTDLNRDCHQWPAAPRLTPAAVAAWQEQFAEAWPLIEDSFPTYAPGLAAGLSTVMPLANDAPGREISAAARQAFGAVAAALPATGADLALLLIHEFQHVKLGALTDMFDLCDRTDQRVFFAPWRDDPRPVGALLQGTYAHIGVTDFWRVRRDAAGQEPAAAAEAAERFARWRMMTAEAIETLAGSGALTPLGDRFVAGMRATVEPWLSEPVPQAAASSAARWAAERRAAWQRRKDS
ncbi:FxsB family cyclophane-forming radical SAM/SPASM peptide maturase [Trebonia kvetii]|uniref:FxsB family cyclophane-forming radical SAM/SPASM peptide maturase n=1 Tax=Trebonia kvetii TaxID=2480626 RepID=UPI001652A604|nr:FxsB family cyclophane-forming radical SAM/SPASM peptide maturase [Trebonia kvetii]